MSKRLYLGALTLLAAAINLSAEPAPRPVIDAPLLFVKRQPYMAPHIYDDYLTWRPGGGIYVIENPNDPIEQHRVRAVIDPTTPETLGTGVYRDPDLSWDAKRVLFAFKDGPQGNTSIYEIGIDGKGLRRLTDPGLDCASRQPAPGQLGSGQHDITPCYLPDGRIAFTSTRTGAHVMCFSSLIDTLHTMNADGSDIRCISANNQNEFDPSVLPDGRILYGRWEYVDKSALYMQSLWTVNPDGSNETALFANNLAKPTALLDARAIPGTHKVVASLTPHNGQAVGAIAIIDPRKGKNSLDAIENLTPQYPKEMDQGLKVGPCDPWSLSEHAFLIANNAKEHGRHGVIEYIDRSGQRHVVHREPDISCYSPMLVKPRPKPPVLQSAIREGEPGRFYVQDIYEGMPGVERGAVKQLRIIETTARVSGIPGGGRWWNQAFLVSWQGSYDIKNYWGVVPVEPDGSVLFEAPTSKPLYFQALDASGRLIQSQRTFVQALPGITRSCVGCHIENENLAPPQRPRTLALSKPPATIEPEPWGSGLLDYAADIQPILDKHCVKCHGGDQGIAAGLDLSGGWTWAFNISYETLVKNGLIGFLNCHNGNVAGTRILPPKAHGSAVAPLAELLTNGHEGRIVAMTPRERSAMLAWIDGNGNYYGTFDYTVHATCDPIVELAKQLQAEMASQGCLRCHDDRVGNDWVNLQTPEWSRILRAPLDPAEGGLGLCRERKAPAVHPLVKNINSPDIFSPSRLPNRPPPTNGTPVIAFSGTNAPAYRTMLATIESARLAALARPRIDMPGAAIVSARYRQLSSPTPLQSAPALTAALDGARTLLLRWDCKAPYVGLEFEIHRGHHPRFKPDETTLIATVGGFRYADRLSNEGMRHYALVAVAGDRRSTPSYASATVPPFPRPVPARPTGKTSPGVVHLAWPPCIDAIGYHVYRATPGGPFKRLTTKPVGRNEFQDVVSDQEGEHRYHVTSVNPLGAESDPCPALQLQVEPESRLPTLELLSGPDSVPLALHRGARVSDDGLVTGTNGYASLANRDAFALAYRLSVECRVRINELTQAPVILSCGAFNGPGWFLQAFNGEWRWHVGGISCDGGRVQVGQTIHLVGVYDNGTASLYVDGRQVARVHGSVNTTPWSGPLLLGQYSQNAPIYQTRGALKDVRFYRCALKPDEITALAQTR